MGGAVTTRDLTWRAVIAVVVLVAVVLVAHSPAGQWRFP